LIANVSQITIRLRLIVTGSKERMSKPPVPTRDAATIVLLRDTPRGLQAYLLRRVPSMPFAPGMHVFPGGRVDPADAHAHTTWFGPRPQDWAPLLSADAELAQSLVCAAVRETFEESGVLLAGTGPDDVADVSGGDWEDARLGLIAHRESLSQVLEGHGLGLRADLIRPWAHWITPEIESRRYDTRFFVAAVPPGQETRDVGGEADATMWLTPAEAMERHHAGELEMLPPTITTLTELSAYATTAEVLAAAPGRVISPILPKMVVRGDDMVLLLPHDEGYPA
jgi:8-oxo-dGTP pyrophosphatase MutT (NUDIX family)